MAGVAAAEVGAGSGSEEAAATAPKAVAAGVATAEVGAGSGSGEAAATAPTAVAAVATVNAVAPALSATETPP